ncbi:heavy-metal-associated domain-containing protein [Rhizobium sp. TRM95111]|uniref:heavy-metal-associated domain-containing protein n=1 Tax=Rhizobium alarense TaxID=2846851 RepID=UPI001F2D8FDB|nr:heavy-metal-associated domain-containing protein [Rhizobium alarense]MCF3642684.1 heavy-metal-associated domain-containing protein [Rhizobium alarense]
MHHLNIPDMSCSHCVSTVEKAVKSVDPDAKVAVDIESKTASIESPAAAEAFVAALENEGYSSKLELAGLAESRT